MKLEALRKYKKILILGYGKEGQASERFLKKYHPGAILGIADKKFEPNYLEEQKKYDLVIRSPGIPKHLVTRPYTTASNIFLANIKNIIVGVTGTKGKSTTVSLIYDILKQAKKKAHLIGNIGRPMLDELLSQIGNEDIFVCEFSSYQLDDIQYSPQISVILDLFPEHMNYHGGVEKYYLAKKNIIKYVKPENFFVYNQKFPLLRNWAEKTICKTVPFEQNLPFKAEDSRLRGEHNKDNIRASLSVARLFGINDTITVETIKKFNPLPHRLQRVGRFKKIIFYDDAISTTPESTIFAIETLKNIGTIFLGGEDRGYDFRNLVRVIKDHKISNIVLFPESGKKLQTLLGAKEPFGMKLFNTDKMKEAVKFAYLNTPKDQICLLSCASPSYSLWKNFEEKGDQFTFWVKRLST